MGIEVKKITAPQGQAVPVEDIRKAIADYKPNLVFVCQGDSSTGVAQPLETIGDACREHGALFLVDTVCGFF